MKSLFLGLTILLVLSSFCVAQTPTQKQQPLELEVGLQLQQSDEVKEIEKTRMVKIPPLFSFFVENKPNKISISHDTRYAAVATKGGSLSVYDLQYGKLILDEPLYESPFYGVVFHPQKNIIASGDRDGIIKLYDLQNKTVSAYIKEEKTPISDVAFSNDGTVLAVAHFGGKVTFYDPQTQDLLQEIRPHPSSIYALEFSNDSSLLATASRDRTVVIWPIGGMQLEKRLKNHQSIVLDCAFSEDDQFLASGSADAQVLVYKKEGNSFEDTPFYKWIHSNWVTSLGFAGDYLITASKDGYLRVFDYKNKSLQKIAEIGIPILSIDIKGDYIALTSPTEIRIYSLRGLLDVQ